VKGGLAPVDISNGASVPVLPLLTGVSGGNNVNVTLGIQPQIVWLDSGSTYSVAATLYQIPNERWVAAAPLTGAVLKAEMITQTYYHQYLLNASYVVETPAAPQPPSLSYTSLGVTTHQTLAADAASIWADNGTSFSVPSGSNSLRWYGGASETVFRANMTITYYLQYAITASFALVGGQAPLQSWISCNSSGSRVNVTLDAQPQIVWLDAQSTYLIPKVLLGLPNERWASTANLTGTVQASATISQVYYHQYLLNLSYFTKSPGSPPPLTANYTSFGFHVDRALNLVGSAIWADAGTPFSVPTTVPMGNGERWASSFTATNASLPIDVSIQYYHEFALVYNSTASGTSQASTGPVLFGEAMGGSAPITLTQGGTVWLDAASQWTVGPPNGGGSPGTRWVLTGPTQGIIAEPMNEQFTLAQQFELLILANPAVGGSVTPGGWFLAGSSVQIGATPSANWAMVGWQGTGQSSYSGVRTATAISLNGPTNETAQFYPVLTVTSSQGGSVRFTAEIPSSPVTVGAGKAYQGFVPAGAPVVLTARAELFYKFVGWSGSSGTSSTSPFSAGMNSPTVISATFHLDYLDLALVTASLCGLAAVLFSSRHLFGRLASRSLQRLRIRSASA